MNKQIFVVADTYNKLTNHRWSADHWLGNPGLPRNGSIEEYMIFTSPSSSTSKFVAGNDCSEIILDRV